MKRLSIILITLSVLVVAFRPSVNHDVSGRITDEFGNAVPGVSVTCKSRAAVSGADGVYRISIADKNGVISFVRPGYEPQRINVNGRSVIDVVLKTPGLVLKETELVGYGAQKRDMAASRLYAPGSPGAAPLSRSRGVAGNGVYDDAGIVGGQREKSAQFDTEDYDAISDNPFMLAKGNPLSTFSIDVDAASYSNIRRMLNNGQLPPAGAVRIEEMVNYFRYDYAQPSNDEPFAIHTEVSQAPWNSRHQLVLIGLQGKKISADRLPASNLVFLIDVSGSMNDPNKLGLVKSSMNLLTAQLRPQDKVSIVVYAGAAGLVLKPTSGQDKSGIRDAIENLEAGGSTAGGEGLRLAYKTAKENFISDGNNRVILCTDGDFNVGESSDDAMERLIEKERGTGVFLTVLGYGMGNYKDNKMQKLADKGNGNHAYIDGLNEARKVLVTEFGGTLFTIARDVKLQVEFNPAKVQGYRLIGYENRMLAKEDFNDDQKDAGELGSGHTVTALYEIIPVGVKSEFLENISVDNLRYSEGSGIGAAGSGSELMTVKFRYKDPAGDKSRLIEHPLTDRQVSAENVTENFRFAASVAEFGMLLRNSKFRSAASFEQVITNARKAKGADEEGYRAEFIRMVQNAQTLVSGLGKTR